MRRVWRWAGLLAGLALPAGATVMYEATVTHVSDGDTVWVDAGDGGAPRKLRIDGIDAPEICQDGGAESRALLAARALHRRVQVQVRRQDDYGRGLARIQLGSEDLGAVMVREGQAWSYRWRHSPGPYIAEEQQARQQRRGLFAQAQPELPRAFRQRHGTCHPQVLGR